MALRMCPQPDGLANSCDQGLMFLGKDCCVSLNSFCWQVTRCGCAVLAALLSNMLPNMPDTFHATSLAQVHAS